MKANRHFSFRAFTLLSLLLSILLCCLCSCGRTSSRTGSENSTPTAAENTAAASATPPAASPYSPEATAEPAEPAETAEPSAVPTESVAQPTEPAPDQTPLPLYLIDYGAWIEWRSAHPEEYEKWKSSGLPQKESFTSFDRTSGDAPVDAFTGRKDRYIVGGLPHGFPYALYGFDSALKREYVSNPASLPRISYEIEKTGLPREELTEFTDWQRRSDYFRFTALSYEDIEVLYSGDENRIRSHFKADDRYAYPHDGLLFTADELRYFVDPFDIGRMFTPESFRAYIGAPDCFEYRPEGAFSAEELQTRRKKLEDSWKEYERIRERDAGKLTAEAAEELIGTFMDLYRNLRYSPDDIAGENLKNSEKAGGEKFFDDKCILKDAGYIARAQFAALDFDLVGRYDGMLTGQIVDCADRYYPHFSMVVSLDPVYYQGEIMPFDDAYALADHIKITFTDNETAHAEVTARTRDGNGEKVFTVDFARSFDRWRISGGSLLDVISA